MKAIIPTAGQGTRLYPHTHTKPKPMVRLAGRPILGHILESFTRTRVDEVVLVIGGPMKNQVVEYANSAYGDAFDFSFVEQASPEGLGHSIYQADPEIGGDERGGVAGKVAGAVGLAVAVASVAAAVRRVRS